jgi:hypothetical protein
VTGRVTELVTHPTDPLTMYVGTARGGVWKSTDGGVTWLPMSDHERSLAIGALALAPSNPQVLYAGTGEGDIYFYRLMYPLSSVNAGYEGSGILRSADGGNTWTLQGDAIFTGACFYRVAVHPSDPNTAFAASNLGLYRTTNGGTTWTALPGLPAITATVVACCDVVVHPTNPNVAYCAFWAKGVYKTSNATAATPTWTKLAGGLPATNLSRIALALSPTAPNNVYALIADGNDALRGFYASGNDGVAWTNVGAAAGVVEVYGAFTLNVAVDVSTPDIVFLSGVGIYKAVRSMGTWAVTSVGQSIHPDNHSFASHPTNHLVVHAGNDGGIYKSTDGGATWDDRINEGLSITQFEFVGQHATSDAMIIGGTQDNGTEMFRNHPAAYHSADGDGGAAGIDAFDPRNVIHTYYGPTPRRSTQGGRFGSYASIAGGISTGGALFYPPWTFDDTNPQSLALGTDRINLDGAQGTGGWPVKVTLPGIAGSVSAVHYPNANLIYAGTSSGQVYRLVRTAGVWTATAVHAAPLPSRWIWDIATVPGDANTIIVVMSGFGVSHAWRGTLSGGGASFTWTNVSGVAPNALPDIPLNALAVDPLNATHYYVGSDIGVFRTMDGGVTWLLFSDGLPNTAVYDLRLHGPTRLLRAATHGRGLWERKLDVAAASNVDLYLRDHLMSTSRIVPTPSPVPAPFEDPLRQVTLGSSLWWWQCADVKIDAPEEPTLEYQIPVADVDYFAFETRLEHRNPQRGRTNRVYVQVHNRGIQTAANVTVKILYADASPGLPELPADFWTAFPGSGTTTTWKPIGAAQVIASLSPKRPEVLEWDWVPPMSAAAHSCLLVVVDSASDPIPPAAQVFDIGTLVTQEKRAGLKNLHVVDATGRPFVDLRVYPVAATDRIRVGGLPPRWTGHLIFPKMSLTRVTGEGLKRATLGNIQGRQLAKFLGRPTTEPLVTEMLTIMQPTKGATLTKVPSAAAGVQLVLMFLAATNAADGTVDIVLERNGKVIGGNAIVLRGSR